MRRPGWVMEERARPMHLHAVIEVSRQHVHLLGAGHVMIESRPKSVVNQGTPAAM